MAHKILFVLALLLTCSRFAFSQTTAFTYQGKLSDGATAATGNYDMQFKLFDTATIGTGAQQGSTVTNATVTVIAGAFSVQLDFGSGAFSGPPRFLEISARPAGSPNPYTLLSPRSPVTSTPYAVRSLNSSVADTLSSACVGCVTSTQVSSVSGSAVTGTIPVASVPTGSSGYVQNTSSPQAASNFNISGNGIAGGTMSANAFTATTQFNIGSSRALSIPGNGNLFVGAGAGQSNSTGSFNSLVGNSAGLSNTSGQENSFFGIEAGFLNTTGSQNSFFGAYAGNDNTTGNSNSFFGDNAGVFNTTGRENSFFGRSAGRSNTTGLQNSFFGRDAGQANITGSNNTFFGYQAGNANSDGLFNVFVGTFAGNTNTSGDSNTIIGYNADVGSSNLTFATAIGAGAVVTTSHTIVIGTPNEVVEINGPSQFESPITLSGVTGGGSISLCLTNSAVVAQCSSSLRYKTNLQTFSGGLDIVRRLHPITFNWKDGGKADVGFGAEEVEQVEPLLIIRNEKDEIEGVKYGQITTVLVNAVNEQQSQIEQLKQQIKIQQRQNEELKKLVCATNSTAEICK